MAKAQRPRLAETPLAGRSSAAINDEIVALDNERAEARQAVADLEARRGEILKTGTDADVERHDAEIARMRRLDERIVARRPDLAEELAAARRREEADRDAAARAEAEAAISAILLRVDRDYRVPAAAIAAFLVDWSAANRLAVAAGIDTCDDRLRRRAGRRHPDRQERIAVFIDENGQDSDRPYPAGNFSIDPVTGDYFTTSSDGRRRLARVPPRPTRVRTRIVPGRIEPAIWHGHLSGLVNLPGISLDDPPHHVASELTTRDDGPRRGR